MSADTKTRPLIIIIAFLLITNIAMIFFLTFGKQGSKKEWPRNGGMYKSLETEVGFSKEQLDTFQALRRSEMEKIKPLFNELRNAKKNLYDLMYDSSAPDSLVDARADSISLKQKDLDLRMYSYFKQIRNLCTPEQLQKFDSSFKKEELRIVGRPPGRENGPPKK